MFRETFDHAIVFHIDPIGSNHHDLLIDCCFHEEKSLRVFKFEAIWTQHEDFQRVVGEGWNEGGEILEDRLKDLVKRLTVCKKKLLMWSKNTFPNFRKIIDQLRLKLASCIERELSRGKLNEVESLTRQIEEEWANEESYWWQRS
ncbi:hypothetical protein K1719_024189 [Acacia pycnantha]|nr:hypothetical protein K1719_024189 [Acacia pycnantha]